MVIILYRWYVFLTISFCIPHLSFISSFFLCHRVLSPPLSTSPASESFCPSIMIVNLGFVKLLPSFSTLTFLFETYATFTRRFDSTRFLVQY